MTSNAPTPSRAVLAGHGDFAAGLASAVAQITGRDDVFTTMTNRGLSGEEIAQTMRAALDAGVRVVFTDLPAGSCTLAARRLQRERPELLLVTGVNLATLLDFVFSIDADVEDTEMEDATTRVTANAVEKGRAALTVVGRTGTPGARGAA
ncbi:MAG: hypothetical protein JO180_01320 [Gemmatirosa sp.]|nr:hypothetical protein [Gemmatirosa sp.]